MGQAHVLNEIRGKWESDLGKFKERFMNILM